MWRIEFTSSEFLPALPEECQGNPGVYRFELAFWLAKMLASQGVVTSYPLGENWGQLTGYSSPEAIRELSPAGKLPSSRCMAARTAFETQAGRTGLQHAAR